ncbi:MAG: alpha/beta hydrolase [Rhodocyclaceae bacterium]
MNRPHDTGLEILLRRPTVRRHRAPLLFVHGAYTAAWCWDEHFLAFFAEAGYDACAVSLSGHGGSRGRRHLDTLSISDYVRDLHEAACSLAAEPVLIGHSMGGMVVQKYLEGSKAAAAVLMASVPPQGLWGSAVGLAFRKPDLLRSLNGLLTGGRVAAQALREAMFRQPIDEQKLAEYHRRMQPESCRAIWDMTLFDLPRPLHMHRPPLLVLGADHDALIPPALVEMTASTYGVEAVIVPGMGHGMMLESGWRAPAARILDWLTSQGL